MSSMAMAMAMAMVVVVYMTEKGSERRREFGKGGKDICQGGKNLISLLLSSSFPLILVTPCALSATSQFWNHQDYPWHHPRWGDREEREGAVVAR